MSPSLAFTFLRLAPLLTSTASLTFAHDHDLFFRCMTNHPTVPASSSNAFIPPFMQTYMPRGLKRIIFFYPGTLLLALLNAYISTSADTAPAFGGLRAWYLVGAVCTLAHVAVFGKSAVGLLTAMRDDTSKGRSREDMDAWANVNVWRTLCVDVPAWMCYLVGVVSTFSA